MAYPATLPNQQLINLQYRLTPELTLLTGLLEQNPQAPSRSHAWSVSTDGSLGILLPLEAEWRTRRFGQPGIYSLGLLYTNAKQTDLYLGQSGGPGAKALEPEPAQRSDSLRIAAA
ncbi:carbohydrate porin [Chromobacterium sp. LK11]|uniref:carbohydrate porin n=1 Tax=Chromobacterium sp. LK11 TaxID=1628212 RepID=UPI0009E42E2A